MVHEHFTASKLPHRQKSDIESKGKLDHELKALSLVALNLPENDTTQRVRIPASSEPQGVQQNRSRDQIHLFTCPGVDHQTHLPEKGIRDLPAGRLAARSVPDTGPSPHRLY